MEESWKREVFEERPVEIFSIRNGFLVDECMIFDDKLRFITNASDRYTDAEVERGVGDIRQQMESRKLRHFPGVGIIGKRRAANNYGHYLMEMLPMAVVGRDLFANSDPRYLLHRVPPPTQDAVFRSMRLLGFNLDRLIVLDFREPVRFEQLVIVRGLTKHGTYMSPLSVAATERMAALIPAGDQKKLFVKRNPGWRRGRALLNQEEVASRLEAKGFKAIDPGSMSLEQQIATFRGADEVVGASGATMTNIVFCRPGTKVILLVPGRFPDTFFWFIATHKKLDYTEIRGDPSACETPDAWKADFTIREADIRKLENRQELNQTLVS